MAASKTPKKKAGSRTKGEVAGQRQAGKGGDNCGAVRKMKAAGRSKNTAEKPTVPGQEKAVVTAGEETAVLEGCAQASTEKADGDPTEAKKISRQDLIERAFQKVKDRLDSKDDVTPATIGALEKLLKLDRDILEESEMPQEIRVLWEETDDDPEQDQ
jgi:hypothetical protein